jgi:hypothetical protein
MSKRKKPPSERPERQESNTPKTLEDWIQRHRVYFRGACWQELTEDRSIADLTFMAIPRTLGRRPKEIYISDDPANLLSAMPACCQDDTAAFLELPLRPRCFRVIALLVPGNQTSGPYPGCEISMGHLSFSDD